MSKIIALNPNRKIIPGLNITKIVAFVALAAALSSPVQAADPIKIGMVAPLTGGAAETGRYQINGAKLAVAHAQHFIENQDLRIGQEGSSNGDALALSTR